MYRPITAMVIIGTLSGCALMDGEKYSQATIDAINQSESNLQQRLDTFNVEIENQNSQIDALNSELAKLRKDVKKLRNNQSQLIAATKIETTEEEIVVVPTSAAPSNTIVLGGIEKVKIDTIKAQFDARVDTGAATSSIDATDVQEFERNGKTWVKFHINDKDAPADEKHWVEAPILRTAKVRQASTDDSEKRIVVELWVQLGELHQKAQFTLADRSHMAHPVLLGREFIQDIALVDVSKTYLLSDKK
ncbi:RimK/LysX family protein [Vibrio sp. SCSIO 43136]|uniref:putative ATP-dependent zinc protease n=1 Tax=Vibrio sp. SCSIO 43136 TaxID=2819101 RepID=UPI0020765EC7|nr:RimK/LysX family protein [Vibrio sp. SCSIO 43136]USD64338.1 ATP-dependent zinc protease [Vibrio sp. SCSIO 43136]